MGVENYFQMYINYCIEFILNSFYFSTKLITDDKILQNTYLCIG